MFSRTLINREISLRRPLSLSLRLTLFFGIAAAGILVVFGWIISQTAEHHFESANNSELEIIANTVVDAMSDAQTDEDYVLLASRFEDILIGHHEASLYITENAKPAIYASVEPDIAAIDDGDIKIGTPYRWNDGDTSYRVLTQTVRANEEVGRQFRITVAVPIDAYLEFLADFRRTLWLTVLVSIAIISILGWLVALRGHTPLHDIVDRISKISARKLGDRLNPDILPDELTALAVSFNDMLTRVDDSFHRLSDFSSDIAHELRTPVTNMMTQAQVALTRSRSVDEYREILYSNIEEYERMAKTIGDMLYMAQADHGVQPNEVSRVDIEEELGHVIEYYGSWAEELGVSISVEGTATMTGDRGMLRRAFGNLLSNAIRHTTFGKSVEVKIDTSLDEDIRVTVENSGPEIPAEHIPRIFNRFHRVQPSKQRDGEGTGLGLAIVKSIAEAHRGHISVTSAAGRTRFTMLLRDAPSLD